MKNKIAVIGLKGLPAFGGAATVGENIIEQLKTNYDFTVYSVSSHTDLKTGEYNGYKQIVFSSIKSSKINILLYYLKSAIHAILFGNYDLIHLHHSDASFIVLILKLRYKVVITTHGVHNLGYLKKWERFKTFFQFQIKYFVPLANLVTCVSKKEKVWLKSHYGIDAIFIPNGVTIPKLHKSDNFKNQIVFSAGRIIQSKGCDRLLQALNNLNYKDKCLIIGDLNQSVDYKSQLLNLSNNLNVEFLGLIKDKNKLLTLISESKIFVYPSEREAMSMMLLEVASVKTPIICADIDENTALFNQNEVQFFSLNSSNDLENKISYALNNYDSMKKNAENAYARIKIENNWNLIGFKYENVYKNIKT